MTALPRLRALGDGLQSTERYAMECAAEAHSRPHCPGEVIRFELIAAEIRAALHELGEVTEPAAVDEIGAQA